uniref:Uncharacterized protein n=1 Tax=Arundo donax TaxID=35708 RepID=A0A0A9BZF5_ARUDO
MSTTTNELFLNFMVYHLTFLWSIF